MHQRDGMHVRDTGLISASGIGTFVFCARKYRLRTEPPDGFVGTLESASLRRSGIIYHRRRGLALLGRLILQRLMLVAALLIISGAIVLWLSPPLP